MTAKLQRYDCKIELDTNRTPENMRLCLIQSFDVFGGMSISQDKLQFSMYDRSMNYAMGGLHTIAKLLASPNTEYIVSIWESGNK